MKKTLLFIATILISVSVFAQTRTTFISEHFDGSNMPSGWQVTGAGTTNWSVSASNNAGGQANELKLHWEPQFNGTSRMVMPAVDLSGVTSVIVSFKHALDNYSGGHTLGIATSSDGGATWNEGWTQSYSSSNSWNVTQTITTADMGNSNVQFSLFYTGNSYNINDWFFDDIEIFSQENLDLSLNSIDINSTLGAGDIEVAFTVQNKGVETVNQFKMSYQINGETPVEEVFEATLSSMASQQFSFAVPATLVPGTYDLTVGIMEVNGITDDDASNNDKGKSLVVALGSTQRIPMIEHFSSSTCGPCVSVNTQMLNLTNNNPGKFTYTKYQMNWPGNGDPYYTAEGGTRRTYYGVSAVPQCFLDGEDQGYAAVTQATLDNHYNSPAFADVRGSFNVTGNTITVMVDFMSYCDVDNAKVFVSVNEKETHNNVGTNGETSFHHIFMKFLTSASGDPVNIEAGNYQHFEYAFDMSSTHVEEMSDLEVSAWIQNYNTKEMLNSHFLYEYTDIHPYPVGNLMVSVDDGMLTASWAAPEGGNALSYNVYVNGELADNVTTTEYSTPATAAFNVVEVEAVYEDDMTSVKMVKAAAGAPVPQTELTLSSTEIMFTDPEEFYMLTITNNTAGDVTINEIYEDSEISYLSIELEDITLPYVLAQGSSMVVYISPVVMVKSLVDTYINIVSSVGTQTVTVTVDDTWVDVEENSNTCEIYPNPTNGNFTVEGANVSKVEVYNLVGQKVYEAQGKTVTIDASSWNKGIYMINIFDQNGSVKNQKLMVR